MFNDIIIVLTCILSVVSSILYGRTLEAITWGCVGIYALMNYIERKLEGSKYDY